MTAMVASLVTMGSARVKGGGSDGGAEVVPGGFLVCALRLLLLVVEFVVLG